MTTRLARVLHGTSPHPVGLLLTWLVALFAAVVVVLVPGARPSIFLWWEIAIVGMIAADLAGGVVANFTESTNNYYSNRPRARIAFLLVHAAHPVVLYIVMNGPIEVWAVIPAIAIIGGLVVNALPPKVQAPVAASVVTVGVVIAFSWHVITPPLVWFAPLFLIKLVLGFAVRRDAAERTTAQPAAK